MVNCVRKPLAASPLVTCTNGIHTPWPPPSLDVGPTTSALESSLHFSVFVKCLKEIAFSPILHFRDGAVPSVVPAPDRHYLHLIQVSILPAQAFLPSFYWFPWKPSRPLITACLCHKRLPLMAFSSSAAGLRLHWGNVSQANVWLSRQLLIASALLRVRSTRPCTQST